MKREWNETENFGREILSLTLGDHTQWGKRGQDCENAVGIAGEEMLH